MNVIPYRENKQALSRITMEKIRHFLGVGKWKAWLTQERTVSPLGLVTGTQLNWPRNWILNLRGKEATVFKVEGFVVIQVVRLPEGDQNWWVGDRYIVKTFRAFGYEVLVATSSVFTKNWLGAWKKDEDGGYSLKLDYLTVERIE